MFPQRVTRRFNTVCCWQDEATEEMAVIPRFDVQPPNIVGGTMKSYQLAGLNWLIRLYETNVNGILADEMGLVRPRSALAVRSPTCGSDRALALCRARHCRRFRWWRTCASTAT